MKDFRNTLIVCLTALGIALAAVFAFYNRAKADDVVIVTGLGRLDFQSDLIAWKGRFSVLSSDLGAAYVKLESSRNMVNAFLKTAGVKASETTVSAVAIDKLYRENYDEDGDYVGRTFSRYELSQTVRIESRDLDRIENVSRTVTDLIKKGVEITSESPDFFYSRLSDLKIELVALATADARSRAEQIARNAGGHLGKMRYASMGVFQIIETNSAEDISWEGAFNTKSRSKTATLTVKVQYELR